MSSELEPTPEAGVSTYADDDSHLLRILGLNPANPKHQALVAVARHYRLDPLLGHVVVIDGSKPYITRDGLLHVAHLSGVFDGIEILEVGQTATHWTARCAVHRKDWTRPVVYPGRYPLNGHNKAYGPEMAIKTAEVMALRRAFDVTGIPTAEEAAVDDDDVAQATGRAALRRRVDALPDSHRDRLRAWCATEGIEPVVGTMTDEELDRFRAALAELEAESGNTS
jgi:hypothetical protein